MNRWFYGALVLLFILAVGYWRHLGYDRNGFYPMLNLLASILLVYVTARYMFAYERDATTRQRVQEEWEARRFYASRIFAIADGCVDLFFAAKHELEVFIGEWEGPERARLQQQAGVSPFGAGYAEALAMVNAQIDTRYEMMRIRYSERAKDYNWRTQALLHQATELLSVDQVRQAMELFQQLSTDFRTHDEAKAVLAKYTELHDQFSGLVAAVHDAADAKLRVRQ